MLEAAFWGLFGASSLVIGALIAIYLRPSPRSIGGVMAFGAGTLISAVAYELIDQSFIESNMDEIVLGMLLGSLAYFGGDWLIDDLGGKHRVKVESEDQEGGDLGIVLGTVLDGIPESFVMGMAFVDGGGASVALIAAIFISNLPEAIASSFGLQRSGWPAGRIILMWIGIAAISGVAAALGYWVFRDASGDAGVAIEAFAAGAILTMLAQTMIPEALRYGGRLVGVITVLGFILSLFLTTAE